MALQQKELFSGVTRKPQLRMAATVARPVVFATDAGAALLAAGTPVHFNGTDWVVWTAGGTPPGTIQEIMGFVYFQTALTGTTQVTLATDPASGTVVEGVQLSASDEVHGVVMLKGRIHYDDIVLPAGEMQSNLDLALLGDASTAVENSPLVRDLIIEGLDNIGV